MNAEPTWVPHLLGQGLRPLHPAKRAGDARAGEGADRARAAQLPVAIRLTLCEAHQAGDQNGVQVQLPPRSRQSSKPPLGVSGQDPPHTGATPGGAVFPHDAVVWAQAQVAAIMPVEDLFSGVNLQASSAGHAPPHSAAIFAVPVAKPHSGGGSFSAGAQRYPQDPERPSAPQTGPRRPPSLARCFADI